MIPSHLSDAELDAAVKSLAGKEPETTGELNLTAVRLLGRHLALQRRRSYRRRARSSSRRPRSATACSSRSASRPMTGFGASRRFFAGRSPMATLERSSIAPRSCFCGRSRRRSSGWQSSHDRGLSVPGRIDPRSLHAIRRERSRGWSGPAIAAAYVAPDGRRCTETTFIEFHHLKAYAHQGPPTIDNIALRCWRHNQYEAELLFGPRRHRPREPTAGSDP